MRPRSLTGHVLALFGASALVVAAIFVALLLSVVNLRSADRTVRRSSDLLGQSYANERTAVDLDTQLRGFLLTGNASFLQPYSQDRSVLPTALRRLRRLARDRTEQARIDQIIAGVDGYIGGYARPLVNVARRLSPAQEARAAVRGEALLASLHRTFRQLDTRIVAVSEKQRADANNAATQAIVVAAIGIGGSILLLLAVGVYLLARVLRPVRGVAAAARRMQHGELDVRVPEAGHGEVARLGNSFNQMASSIQNREAELRATQEQLAQAAATAQEASEMKSNFLANMSHETRTPLNGVIGMLSLLSDTPLTPEQREYVDVARTSSDALMTVVNDVLDVAKIEAGRLELERRDFDLHDLVETNCDMVAASALSKGVELQSFVRDDVPRAVRGDRMRVGQILGNLLSNAVKFTAQGEVGVEVSLVERTDSATRIRFEVSDTGIGIDPDRIDRLFEPFVQAEVGTTREFGGTGLGLAISLELTKLMGGEMGALSQPGQGSTFNFVIPFAPAKAPLRTPVAASELRGLHVLVVDDNPTNRRVFEAYVASWTMRPEVARDAAEALDRLRGAAGAGDPFDVALLDLNMPGESGLELARRITATPALHHTRLILLTSSGEQQEDDEVATGIRYHLVKPVRQSRLLDAISAAMADERPEGVPPPAAPQERESEPAMAAAQEREAVPAVASAPRVEGPPSTWSGARILVAEDQPANWLLVDRMLARRGHRATNAVNGRQVLEMMEREPYDLIFMDCQMPILDGYDTALEIRRQEEADHRARVPIVAMTANAMLGDRELCLAVGMDDYIAKPISLEAIDKVLARWLLRSGDHADPGSDPTARSDDRMGSDPTERSDDRSGAGVLDPARLSELRELFSEEEMSGMLRRLVGELSGELERVDAALANGDGATVAAAAHQLTNCAQMIGARRLSEAAARATAATRDAHAANGSAAASAVEALHEECGVVRAAIEAELAQV